MPEVDFENLNGAQQKAVVDAIRPTYNQGIPIGLIAAAVEGFV